MFTTNRVPGVKLYRVIRVCSVEWGMWSVKLRVSNVECGGWRVGVRNVKCRLRGVEFAERGVCK